MADSGTRLIELAVLLFTLVAIGAAAVVVLETVTAPSLDVGHIPRWTAIAGLLLAVVAIALPASILFGWQSAREAAREEGARERRRS
ncbi:hypothetical protein [Haloterrigena alkaliphila]|uniref:Uncharacterized protein n=1 Tax=Haloterrigena alkaliphila TaxID=2816475 RepID=A0A8A2VII4_9EURY|nr:hypothetical protein [Haloterrigena alkaliphila]QSX00195.1 hypothetical protein J0X25_04310 [Haloterrigena alkaliphila]